MLCMYLPIASTLPITITTLYYYYVLLLPLPLV